MNSNCTKQRDSFDLFLLKTLTWIKETTARVNLSPPAKAPMCKQNPVHSPLQLRKKCKNVMMKSFASVESIATNVTCIGEKRNFYCFLCAFKWLNSSHCTSHKYEHHKYFREKGLGGEIWFFAEWLFEGFKTNIFAC